MTLKISIIVCTYNRTDTLKRALESLVQQTLNKSLYEIIVVDNTSTDATSFIVRDLQAEYETYKIVAVYEGHPGLSHARNTGVKHAQAPYVAFMDDDAKASPDWLEIAIQCFEEVYPKPVAIGGPILPLYDATKPIWFKDEYEIRTWGDHPRFLNRSESFSGSNMIFSKNALEIYGPFDVNLGVKGNYLSGGEERGVFDKIWADSTSDSVLYYSPRLVIFHSVPDYKMTIRYRLKRAFVSGQVWYLKRGPKSLCQRLRLFTYIMVSIAKSCGLALKRWHKYRAYQHWIIDEFGQIAYETGFIVGCLGFTIRVRQK